jgi:uncharacterized protein
MPNEPLSVLVFVRKIHLTGVSLPIKHIEAASRITDARRTRRPWRKNFDKIVERKTRAVTNDVPPTAATVDAYRVDSDSSGVEVRTRPVFGRCVYALRSFAKDEILIYPKGQWLSALTQYSLQQAPGRHFEDLNIVGYLAHSCDPNCRFEFDPPALIALRDIGLGDLVTIDYEATEEVLARDFECRCGHPSCRGVIMGYRARETAEKARSR